MGVHGVAVIMLVFLFTKATGLAVQPPLSVAQPGCQDTCGDVSIPFPFGIGAGCAAKESFVIRCDNYFSNPAKPFIGNTSVEVVEISLDQGTVSVNNPLNFSWNGHLFFPDTYTQSASVLSWTYKNGYCNGTAIDRPDGYVYCQKNEARCGTQTNCYRAYGYEAQAVQPPVPVALPGCQDTCGDVSIPFPFGIEANCAANEFFAILCNDSSNPAKPFIGNTSVEVVHISLDQRTVSVNNPLNFSWNGHLFFPDTYTQSASVLSWTYKNRYCNGTAVDKRDDFIYCGIKEARCGNQTDCYCADGYEGNPFLQDGCQDVNECLGARTNSESALRQVNRADSCSRSGGRCVNTEGGYICSCPSESDFRYFCYKFKNNKARMAIIDWISVASSLTTTGTCSGLGALFVLVCSWRLCKILRKRKKRQLKEKFFKRNGGLILQQQLSSGEEGNVEKTKLFTSKALEKATDNFNQNRVLGQGGQGTVYKGMLPDGRIVAIKKSKIDDDEGKVEHFINEVVILSRISHQNVVKLHGCCLETEVPLLVYEFIPNGTLFEFIHGQNEELPLSCWDMRLRIATEVAGALSYLHSAAAIPIYHRDIKSANILLDEKYRSKVADFGTSRSISVDQTHLTTRVLGTWGYLDPEYFQSSQFTDKSDVYSFGVVLIELLTGQKPISSTRSEEARSLATQFILAMKETRLYDILDARVAKEGSKEEVMRVANLAKRCLNLNGRKRPTMKEVATELEDIKKWHGAPDSRHHKEEEGEEVCAFEIEQMSTGDTASTSTKSFPNNSLSASSDIQPLLFD
ncbi:hypothetical protein RJ640_024648 [Escallonia rubra]|uniref:Protein kinase domain-containing protein n=1 Tax=Escallonia rubra TaxID=112253 RepID=A0AA88UJG8_9ASTE|nr:hypothetical protein RJ640_024648 [Escallonia rubra]